MKIKNTKKIGTWLPLFNGFNYGSIWGYNDRIFEQIDNPSYIGDMDIIVDFSRIKGFDIKKHKIENSWFNDKLKEKLLDNLKEKVYNEVKDDIDWYIDYTGLEEYCLNNGIIPTTENILFDMGLVEKIEFDEQSKRGCDIEVELSDKNIENIKNQLEKHKEKFKEYLKNTYTSYDGFLSHYSNDIKDWKISDIIDHRHKLGSVLEFILKVNDIKPLDVYYEVEEKPDFRWVDFIDRDKMIKEEQINLKNILR